MNHTVFLLAITVRFEAIPEAANQASIKSTKSMFFYENLDTLINRTRAENKNVAYSRRTYEFQ